ncbi:MAG: hypothetical protein KF820_04680 [Candidatus Paracaedibacteraceae bacterium]|nr:hypothetical protein [Candidatus Paracaedibacteraceae bacterium]
MKYFVFSFITLCLLGYSPASSHESDQSIYTRMISSAIMSTMEEHHSYDWKEISDTASKFWKDPSSALDQEVRRLQGKFQRFLFSTFLGDQASVKKIMKRYFDYQLECLVADHEKAPISRYQFWSKIPSHYHAILAFELLAVELGIKLDHNYHEMFSLVSERTRMIEDAAEKLMNNAEKGTGTPPPPAPPLPSSVVSFIPKPPQSPSLKLKHLTKDRAQKLKKPTPLTTNQLAEDLSGLKKTTTRAGSSSLSENVLDEIRKGSFMLKPASQRVLKELPADNRDNDLLAILRNRFELIRPMLSEND